MRGGQTFEGKNKIYWKGNFYISWCILDGIPSAMEIYGVNYGEDEGYILSCKFVNEDSSTYCIEGRNCINKWDDRMQPKCVPFNASLWKQSHKEIQYFLYFKIRSTLHGTHMSADFLFIL